VKYILLLPFVVILNFTIPFGEPWNPIFGIFSPFFISLMILIFSPWDDPLAGFSVNFGVIPLWAIFLIVSTVLSGIIYMTTHFYRQPPRFKFLLVIFGFLMCVFWIFTIANELVSILHTWGLILNISETILGLTVLAWGNCIGDMVSDVVVAKQGFPGMAIAACFGGPLFNLLVGLGIALTFGCISKYPMVYPLALTNTMVIAFIFLGVGLLSTLVVVPLNGFVFPKKYAIYLYFLYFGMTFTNILNSLGVF